MTTSTLVTTRFWRFVLALSILLVSPLLEAQFNTPLPGGVTSTPDTVGIGTSSPQAKLHVFSSSGNNVFSAFGPNGNGFGVTFSDTQPTEGYGSGIVANFTGNSMIRVSNLQIGSTGTPVIQSTNTSPLYLNRWSPQDVVISQSAFSNGLRVEGFGNSSFAGAVGIGTLAPPTKKLQVAGSISLNNDSSTTALNNAYFLFDSGSTGWGAWSFGTTVGFKNNRYRTMLFSADGGDVAISTHVAGTAPTSQASFTERLTVKGSNGNVGIGVLDPFYPLSVLGTIQASDGVLFPDGITQRVAYPFSAGTNTAAVDLNRAVAGPLTSSVTNTNTSTSGSANLAAIAGSGAAYVRLASNETPATRDWRIGMTDNSGVFRIRNNVSGVDLMTITGTAIHFNGDVDGTTIHATFQDLAEWVPAAETMPAGTVVVVAEDANNTVTASMHAYDTSVAGVVSANPGLLLGVASESKAKIATTGRVRVRVDATKSPIRKGDLLVTSDQPGMAMKSEPLDLAGVKIHRPGTLIGKALEPLVSGQGEILVLLSLQ